MHILKDQIHLRHRPWHFKLRFNIADHTVARYNAGEPTFPWQSLLLISTNRCGRVWVARYNAGEPTIPWQSLLLLSTNRCGRVWVQTMSKLPHASQHVHVPVCCAHCD